MTYFRCSQASKMAYYLLRKGGRICQEKAPFTSTSRGRRGGPWSNVPLNIRHHILKSLGPRSSSSLLTDWKTRRSESAYRCHAKSFPVGANVFSTNAWPAWMSGQGEEDLAFFSPQIIMEVKALACELPMQLGLPFSRLSHQDINWHRAVPPCR